MRVPAVDIRFWSVNESEGSAVRALQNSAQQSVCMSMRVAHSRTHASLQDIDRCRPYELLLLLAGNTM